MPNYTCYAPRTFVQTLTAVFPTMCLSKNVCITTIEYKHHSRRMTDHDDWPRYDSAPFWLTRTRPCATFDIRGHVWVESFHCFAHCERTMRCVQCKTTCVHITFRLTKTCICVTINISHYVFHLPFHRYTWILIPPRDFLTYKSFSISHY